MGVQNSSIEARTSGLCRNLIRIKHCDARIAEYVPDCLRFFHERREGGLVMRTANVPGFRQIRFSDLKSLDIAFNAIHGFVTERVHALSDLPAVSLRHDA
ncbi:hypothetical protein CES86_3877 [Brucella lupini]|uniref:Uncharacterized protein n=1 Tax=Brucella lupini TaxID=255457 RepID=A0A256GH30_9HYPH|nr:hypothetical protein CES86_3877 [Brucella lupini]